MDESYKGEKSKENVGTSGVEQTAAVSGADGSVPCGYSEGVDSPTVDEPLASSDAGIIPVHTSCDTVEDMPEECNNDTGITHAEQTFYKSADKCSMNTRAGSGAFFRFIYRAAAAIFCAAGVISYSAVGMTGVNWIKDGGFVRTAAYAVFGGIRGVEAILPALPDDVDLLDGSDGGDGDESGQDLQEFLNVVHSDLGAADPTACFNETGFDTDTESVAASSAVPDVSGASVLIIHTHGTESYAPESGEILKDEDFRDEDPENNMIAVGAVFAKELEDCGIRTLHCTELFDSESYIDAYSRSAAAVAEYTENDPSIKYVVDIHRDAVIRDNGDIVRSDGDGMAQVMIVCGTDEKGAVFPDWRENLAFGFAYQSALYERLPKLVRHLNLRGASFNEQLADRYLLLEIGTCGNTLSEAKISAAVAAQTFAELISEK